MPFRWKVQENHLHEMGGEVARQAGDIIGKGILDIHARTVAATPAPTGRLKTGWQAVLPERGSADLRGGVGNNVEYAAYVELGTGRAGAGSGYPFGRGGVRYTMSWPGMRARAMLGNAGAQVLPTVYQLLTRLGGRMRKP
jgi:hypothetical protein